MKRKAKQKFIPGLGAARSAHLLKSLRDERREAAAHFIEVAEDHRRMDYAFNSRKDSWTGRLIVQLARSNYTSAALADLYRAAA